VFIEGEHHFWSDRHNANDTFNIYIVYYTSYKLKYPFNLESIGFDESLNVIISRPSRIVQIYSLSTFWGKKILALVTRSRIKLLPDCGRQIQRIRAIARITRPIRISIHNINGTSEASGWFGNAAQGNQLAKGDCLFCHLDQNKIRVWVPSSFEEEELVAVDIVCDEVAIAEACEPL